MFPPVVRHLVYPLHERVLGRPTFRCLRELEDSQWVSPDDLGRLQERKLLALLRHAYANTAFYRRRFRQAGVDITNREPYEMLARLPLLDKSEIREDLDSMVCRSVPGGVFPCVTGGSTGEPLMFWFDRRRQAYDQAARIRTHRWFGVDVGQRELYLWGSPIESRRTNLLKRVRDALFNERLISAFSMSEARMDDYLEVVERFRPACIFGYPSSLALLAEYAESRGRQVNTPCLRAVFVTGEVCYSHYRRVIESYFGVPVADGYGSREVGFIAHECPRKSTHLMGENVLVEIVENGQPVQVGQAGEIVVTHLDAYAMPFIRYRTGDIGRLRPGRCECGRGLPLLDVVQGRATDFLYLPNGDVKHALSIIYPLRSMNGLRQFRVTQHEDYTLTVDVVCDDRNVRVTRDAVIDSVRPVVDGQVAVRVEMVDRIPSVESGKYRYVVSHARPSNARLLEMDARG
ncbi:MAG: phenylacetate--CoA ligase family protein [Phycisphaerae bacterium]